MDQLHVKQDTPAAAVQAKNETPTGVSSVMGSASSAFRYTSLIDPRMEHDSCGVGFVASALGKRSHDILQKALIALARLEHRGAVATDGKSSDGVGILTGIPKALLLAEMDLDFDSESELGVGMIFLPPGEIRAEAVIESCLASQDLRVLGWRNVPICTEVLGEIALNSMPVIRQVLVADAASSLTTGGVDPMDKRLYLARKQFERAHELGEVTGYVCSLSSKTIVYKSLCLGSLLP
jgi:glutamate synthase (ferredoxin)